MQKNRSESAKKSLTISYQIFNMKILIPTCMHVQMYKEITIYNTALGKRAESDFIS